MMKMYKMKHVRMLLALLIMNLCCACAQAQEALVLPRLLTEINDETFCNTMSLDEVVVPYGVKRIGSRAFANSGIKRITLPTSITSIAKDAFADTSQDLVAVVDQDSYAHTRCKSLGIKLEVIETLPAEYFTYKTSNGHVTITGCGDRRHLNRICEFLEKLAASR